MNFNSSKLVRMLSEAGLAEADPSKQDFAERVSQWVGAFDAVRLHDALQSIPAVGRGATAGAQRSKLQMLENECQNLRKSLIPAVTHCHPPASSEAGEVDVSYAAYRKFYADQQRQMGAKIASFRVRVRQVLDGGSPQLQQLAALDAVMETLLASREHSTLSKLPGFLEGHFKQLRQTHQQAADATGQVDDTAVWRQPGGWLYALGQALNEALQAELDVRLQPVMGLIEAFSNEVEKKQ